MKFEGILSTPTCVPFAVLKSETANKGGDEKKGTPPSTGPKEKLIDDEKSEEAMKLAGKTGKSIKKAGKNNKNKETSEIKVKHHKNKAIKEIKQKSVSFVAQASRPKELIPEDIKIVRKEESINADNLPGASGGDPTIGRPAC